MGSSRAVVAVAVLGATMSATASCWSIPDCPEWKSPCAEPFDIGEWCGDSRCTVGGQPLECRRSSGCELYKGEVLSIPIGEFAGSLQAHDVKVDLSAGSCIDGSVNLEDITVKLDGVPGTGYAFPGDIAAAAVFRWDPVPEAPSILEVSYDGASPGSCARFELYVIDGPCEAANPPPDCPR